MGITSTGRGKAPNTSAIFESSTMHTKRFDAAATTFFLSREELLPGRRSDLPPLRRRAFMQMARSAQVIADYYGLPPSRVVEIGTRLEI